ncbi:MAG: lipoyl(octanoyl) transferase LipB [Thermoplasmataceae archaeon]
MDLVFNLGTHDYVRTLEFQHTLVDLRNSGRVGDALIFVEHPDTYTAGIHRDSGAMLDPSLPVIFVERGGAYTFHGPGQVIVYFVINMKERRINIRDLIIFVQNSIVSLLAEYGIKAEGRLNKETGVWVQERKICSIGFAVRGFSTFHGIALNVSTDLNKFHSIMPCGFDASIMTSVRRETGSTIETEEVRLKLERKLVAALKMEKIKKYLDENTFLKDFNVQLSGTVP